MTPLVHSAEGLSSASSYRSISSSSPLALVLGSSLQRPSGHTLIKVELAPQDEDFTQEEVDEMVKRAWEIKTRFELRQASSSITQNSVHSKASDESVQQVDTERSSVTMATQPGPESTPRSLTKSLYGSEYLLNARPPDGGGTVIAIKAEVPEQDLKVAPMHDVSDRDNTKQMADAYLNICDTVQSDNDPQHRNDAQGYPPNSHKMPIQASYTRTNLSCDNDGISTEHSSSPFQPSSINMQYRPPLLKLTFHACLNPLRPVGRTIIYQWPPRVGAHLPRDRQPPGDGIRDLLNHQAAPQSSPFFKSLFGLAQCRPSQLEAYKSFFNSTDASDMQVPNQGQSNDPQMPDPNGVVEGYETQSGT
ncbi:hypothetical protein RSAG8_12630, partial [Rhizoctonia solani AG-8 WAC10335]